MLELARTKNISSDIAVAEHECQRCSGRHRPSKRVFSPKQSEKIKNDKFFLVFEKGEAVRLRLNNSLFKAFKNSQNRR